MQFTFGKYEGLDIEYVVTVDRKYCEWIADKIKNKKQNEELYKNIVTCLNLVMPEIENPNLIKFGKYQGCEIEEFIFTDKPYVKWLLEKESFKFEYPQTYKLLKKYYDTIYIEQVNEVVYFYILTFVDRNFVKVGITSNFIVKRIYSYSHTINFYDAHIIDYSNSFVYKSNDKEIEEKVLTRFKEFRIDKKSERINITPTEIGLYLKELYLNQNKHYCFKKGLQDFIPFDFGNQFKESFYIKINEFKNFQTAYEGHLERLGLLPKYNPNFLN